MSIAPKKVRGFLKNFNGRTVKVRFATADDVNATQAQGLRIAGLKAVRISGSDAQFEHLYRIEEGEDMSALTDNSLVDVTWD